MENVTFRGTEQGKKEAKDSRHREGGRSGTQTTATHEFVITRNLPVEVRS